MCIQSEFLVIYIFIYVYVSYLTMLGTNITNVCTNVDDFNEQQFVN